MKQVDWVDVALAVACVVLAGIVIAAEVRRALR